MKRRGMKKAAAPEEKLDPRPWKPLAHPDRPFAYLALSIISAQAKYFKSSQYISYPEGVHSHLIDVQTALLLHSF